MVLFLRNSFDVGIFRLFASISILLRLSKLYTQELIYEDNHVSIERARIQL